jgi:hypothetical protein
VIDIRPLRAEDRAAWEILARGYKDFYRTHSHEQMWQRMQTSADLRGLGVWLDGRLIGIAHYLFHAVFWSARKRAAGAPHGP